MATVITNGNQTVKLYQSVNRGKAMYQLLIMRRDGGFRKNFADKAEAKRVLADSIKGTDVSYRWLPTTRLLQSGVIIFAAADRVVRDRSS